MVVAGDTIGMYQQDRSQTITQSSLLQFDNNLQESIPQSGIHLSPDGHTLAVMQSDQDLLVLTDLDTGKQQSIQMEKAPEGYILHGWSPNGRYFSLSDQATRIYYIIDTIEVTLNPIDVLNVSTQVVWTSDSLQLIFKGPGECYDCLIRGQLYLLDVQTLKASPLLDTRKPELTDFDWISQSNPSIGTFTFYDSKLYFEISERSDFEKQQTNFYAFDLQTQEISRMNVDLLFPDKILGFAIRNIGYEIQTQRLMILTDFDIIGGYQWAIIDWTVGTNPKIIYEKVFRGEASEAQIIASSVMSPNQQQIAIAAVDPTRQTSGSVTVVDVVRGQEVWYEGFDQPVCQVEMPADNLVVYGLVAGRCESLADVTKPVNQVVSTDLQTQESTTLILSETPVFFVTSDN